MPGQEFVEPADGVIGDAGEYVGEPRLRIDVVEAGGLNERGEDGPGPGAGVRSREERIAAHGGDDAMTALDGVEYPASPPHVASAGRAP